MNFQHNTLMKIVTGSLGEISLKIYINREPVAGPWGGGNKTITNLSNKLKELGHKVIHQLTDEDIDIIYCHDPRPNVYGEWYQHFLHHRVLFKSKIVQRVGDVGSHGKPDLYNLAKQTSNMSDFVVFPSEWAKEAIEFSKENCEVIHNAPLKEFYKHRNTNTKPKFNIVTHHWSTNPKKGFHFYKFLDDFVGKNPEYSFTYIGRLPEGTKYNNINHIPATGNNEEIGRLLSENSIYLSASEEEAGANHVLEGLAAGLPVVYRENGGSIDNYCKNYGYKFNNFNSMIEAINHVYGNYKNYKSKVLQYDNTIDKVIDKYVEIICNIK